MCDTRQVAFGPQQMPPQGARALVNHLLGGYRGGPAVSATLDESEPGETVLEFVNEGGATAVDLRYIACDDTGSLSHESAGSLAPGAVVRRRLRFDPPQPFRCVWLYENGKGRVTVWSYDGRHKRLRAERDATPEAIFHTMYR